MTYEDHQHGDSSLSQLNIGMVSQFPLDYMHLVCLGVMKKLLALWMSGPLHVRIGNNMVQQISAGIYSLMEHLPREFLRKGRGLTEFERWKATEFRSFLLYTGTVVL